MKKDIKKHLHQQHGEKFQHCDFGKKEFNPNKRDTSHLTDEELSRWNRPTHGHKTTTSTTTAVPPSTTSTTTDSQSTTTSTTKVATSGAVIYLDFDGQTVRNTQWNVNGDIVCTPAAMPPADVDAVLASVQQDYAKYNVTVTADEAVYNAADPKKRTRVIITESWEWYCGSTPCAGGVGFIGSMFWGDDTPCFVFSSALSHSPRYVGDAAIHEAGHTIGLYHQSIYDASCNKTAEYNPGDANCDCAPNMGVTYYHTIRQWIRGTNSQCCTCIQDDNQVITSKLGLK